MADKEAPLLRERQGTSVREATINLIKICVGSGVMALPWGFLQGGSLALGSFVLIGLWNWYTTLQLVQCRRALASDPEMWALGDSGGAPRSAYSALALAVLGRPGLLLLEGSLLVVLTGVGASLQIQFAQFASSLLPSVAYAVWVLASAVALAPLMLQRTLSRLSRVSAAGLLVLGCGLLAVGLDGWRRFGTGWRLGPSLCSPPGLRGAASFFGIAAFSYGCQTMILPVQDSMAQPRRVGAALSMALAATTAFYLLVGAGLAALYEAAGVRQLIILNLEPGSAVGLAVEGCSALVALLSYPLPLVPVVQLLLPTCAAAPAAPESSPAPDAPRATDAPPGCCASPRRREEGVRLGLLAFTTAVALVVPNFGAMAGFLGCLNVSMAQLLPPLLHLRLVSLRAWQRRRGATLRLGAAVARDALLLLLGAATLVFFSAVTGATLVAHDHPTEVGPGER